MSLRQHLRLLRSAKNYDIGRNPIRLVELRPGLETFVLGSDPPPDNECFSNMIRVEVPDGH